jgi:ethanolamine utilization protein EutN
MQLGTVAGTATSTVKHPSMRGWRLLVVQLLAADGLSPDGDPVLAIDKFGAGPGETVIVTNDGRWSRDLTGSDNTPVRWAVMGLKD